MAGFLTPLELEYMDGHLWKVTSPFEYCVGSETSSLKVVIPTGFFTDFASIPRMLWSFLPPTGQYGKAAVVHDWLYQYATLLDITGQVKIDRRMADDVLNEAMGVLGVGSKTRSAVYWGVRIGGWKPWNEYRAKEPK